MPGRRLLLSAVACGFVPCATGAGAEVVISSKPTTGLSCASGICAPTAKNAVLNATDLENLLATGSVKVTTGTLTNDIKIQAAFSWASANALTLDARRSIIVDRTVSVAGTAGLALTTNDGSTKGDLTFGPGGNVSFLGTGNRLTIDGKVYALESSIAALASAIAARPGGHYAFSASYNAGNDGTYKNSPIATEFDGVFEGLGNSISNLSVSGTYRNEGLFASIASSGTVRDLNLVDESVAGNGKSSVGGVAGRNRGLVQNDSVSGQFSLLGAVRPKVQKAAVGALIGYNSGTIRNDSSTGTVSVSAGIMDSSAGGLVGTSYGRIFTSHSAVNLTVPDSSTVGGLVGVAFTNTFKYAVRQCYATGSVSAGSNSTVGGLAGGLGAAAESFATGPVIAGNNSMVGGLAGGTGSEPISNSYATGSVSAGSNSSAGGIFGWFTGNGGLISDVYSTGSVTAGLGSFIGGFVGADRSGGGEIAHTYWDTTTSGITNPGQGAGNIDNDPGIAGLTTSQLQSGLPDGFSSSIWGENANRNGGLPYLLRVPPSP